MSDELKAGCELDALVEALVFKRNVERIEGVPMWVEKTLPGTPYVLKDGREGHSIRPYSTEIAAAWEIVRKILERKWWMFDLRSSSPGVGVADFCNTVDLASTRATASRFTTIEEIPAAICNAALKAVATS